MFVIFLTSWYFHLQTKTDLGLAPGLPPSSTVTNMKLEAVMENLQRQHQQRLINQQKSDDIIKGDTRCNGDNYSDSSDHGRRSYSDSPKGPVGGDDSCDEERQDVTSPMRMSKHDDDDDDVANERCSPTSDRSSALMAQQMAFAAALAHHRSSPENGIPSSLSNFMPQAMLQQLGQFQTSLANFDPSQLPQVTWNLSQRCSLWKDGVCSSHSVSVKSKQHCRLEQRYLQI